MTDIWIRTEGHAGRITLTRPGALNALSYPMCLEIDAALIAWRDDPAVDLILIDAEGEKAFCAGGDIVKLYETAKAGDYDHARDFWRDEYRMNARIADYPKPVVSFLQGFTMGGGVGLGGHTSHRIVGDSSRIAMPECGIGLVPDVGGSILLARLNATVPGLGALCGTIGHRQPAGEACLGFASHYLPEAEWPALKARLCETGKAIIPERQAPPPAPEPLALARHFTAEDPGKSLAADPSESAQKAAQTLSRMAPLATACHLEILRRLAPSSTIRDALVLEYRYTYRCLEQGDFLEGIRATLIDKDRSPKWAHASLAEVTPAEVEAMLAPLGPNELTFP